MQLTIKMPPIHEREALVESFAEGIRNKDGFQKFNATMGRLLEQGHSAQGIMCMMTHISTCKLIRLKVGATGTKINMDAICAHPFSLN